MSQETRVLHVMYVYHETPHRQQNWSKRQWIWIETIDTIWSNSVIILATESIDLNINCKDACIQHLYFWDSEIVCDYGMCSEQLCFFTGNDVTLVIMMLMKKGMYF